MLEGMRRDDAPPVPQLAVPVSVVAEAYCHGESSKCPKQKAVRQLCLIAFFYLLRVGEYTALDEYYCDALDLVHNRVSVA